MAKKTYYESGDCYLDAKNRRMSKDGLTINIRDEKLAKNLHFKIAYETEKRGRYNDNYYVVTDEVSGHKNIILSSMLTGDSFHPRDNKDIVKEHSLSALRIAREYAQNNSFNLKTGYFYDYNKTLDCVVYDKEKKLTYPLTKSELEELSKHGLKINVLLKEKDHLELPYNIEAEIDMTPIKDSSLSLNLYDENGETKTDFRKLNFIGTDNVDLIIQGSLNRENTFNIKTIELPKDEKDYSFYFSGHGGYISNIPLYLFKNRSPAKIKIRNKDNVHIQNGIVLLTDKFFHEELNKVEKMYLKEVFRIMRENNIDVLQYVEDLKTYAKEHKIEDRYNKDVKICSNKAGRARKILKDVEKRNHMIDDLINFKEPKNALEFNIT